MRISTKILVLLSLTSSVKAAIVTSHTFFSVRPNFQSAMPERVSLFRNEILDECQGFGGALEIVPFGGRMTEDGSVKLAKFFLPPGCTGGCLNVIEYNPILDANPATSNDGNPLKNLEARHFNIRTKLETFASTICFRPRQSTIGVGLCYKQTLSQKDDGTPRWWFEAAMPIEQVRNSMHLTETIENTGDGPRDELGLDNSPRVGSMKEAFAQKTWLFGRITDRCHRKTGIADVELKVGYNSLACEPCTIHTYIGLIIPTGTKVTSKEVWQPIVGNNHHYGVQLGSSFLFDVFRRGCYSITMYLNNDTRYLFANNQIRSFDLIGKPWSRYMETYSSSEQAAAAATSMDQNSGTSGINLFTRCVRVSPHISANFNTAFTLAKHNDCSTWLLEGGYNLWARQAESLELQCSSILSNAALKGVNGMGQTTVARTIKYNFPTSDYDFNQRYASLSNCDIDLESASHPATIDTIVYFTLGYRWERECPGFIAFGGSYEFTAQEINTSLDRWLIWGKFCVTF